MNELASKTNYLRVITQEESKSLKRMLLLMYSDFSEVCNKNGLTFMLGGGSCLGAVRHNGFIPWDDDLDLMMYRSDYDKLIRICEEGALGECYEIDVPGPNRDSKTPYLKIYRKGTIDNELLNESTPFPKGVFLDVFPMDSAPRHVIWQRVKGFISDTLQIICTCVLYSQYPSKRYMEFVSQDSAALKRYKLRIWIGRIFGIIPHNKWVYWFDCFNSSVKETGYITIPTGRKHYFGETRKKDVYFPVSRALFQGIEMPVCNDCDAYLKSLYNNYMELPPVEKRERHMVYQFECHFPD